MFYIRLREEGGAWRDVEVLSLADFQKAWAEAQAGKNVPCALGFARKFVGSGEERRPVGVVYDFIVAKHAASSGKAISPWRSINEDTPQ
jgi:hypothetical protein